MMATARDKTGKVYKIRELLQNNFQEEYEAEQRLLRMEREIEKEVVAANELIMTCEDEDPFVEPENASLAEVLQRLSAVSSQIGEATQKMATIQKEVADVSVRVQRVEKKLGTTLATLEEVKNVMAIGDVARPVNAADSEFEFNPVSSEEELNELDYKLGSNTEYLTKLTNWLNMKIVSEEPNKRLHEAMDLVFERQFLPKCSWKGGGKPERKIPMSAQTNIMKMFLVLGSTRFIAITDAFVAKFFLKKLPHAKERLDLQDYRSIQSLKRASSSQVDSSLVETLE
uniref:DUF4806 domain-containing protein n=1 Tax=Anopheles epiroticus TaxID=199890 RepID=A0A182PN82_9DIPT